MSQIPPPAPRASGTRTTLLIVVLVLVLVAAGGLAGLFVWRGAAQPQATGGGQVVRSSPSPSPEPSAPGSTRPMPSSTPPA